KRFLLRVVGVLVARDDLDLGELARERREESFLALRRALRGDLVSKEDDPTFSAQDLRETSRGEDATLTVVRCDVGREVLAGLTDEPAVEDDDGKPCGACVADGLDESRIRDRSQRDSLDAARDEVLDEVDLKFDVALRERAVP